MTISEASRQFELTPDTLRYYERIGLIPRIGRTSGGNRSYTQEDCKWIEFAKCMRSAGLPIEVLIRYVQLFQQGDSTIDERKKLLIEQRNQLLVRIEDMQKTLERLDDKIDRYEQAVLPVEKGLR